MRKIFLISVLTAAAISAAAVMYLVFTNRSDSESMSKAVAEMQKGHDDLARRILSQVVARDSANEEAYRLLAKIAEKNSDYRASAQAWEKIVKLNPLDKSAKIELIKTLCIGRLDEYLIHRISDIAASDLNFDAPLFYQAACAYIRRDDSKRAEAILAKLEKEKSPYAKLLKARLEIAAGNFKTAKITLTSLVAENPAAPALSIAHTGLALCDIVARDIPSAQKNADLALEESDIFSKADALAIKARVALLKNDIPEALKCLLTVLKIQTGNVALKPDAAELAFAIGDANAIAEIRKGTTAPNKTMAELDYYLKALEDAAKGKYADAWAAYNLCGSFKSRPGGRLAAFKIACETGDSGGAEKLASEISVLPLPAKLKVAIAADLQRVLVKEKNPALAAAIARTLVKFDPSNPLAQQYSLLGFIASKDFNAALRSANAILAARPQDPAAVQGACIALIELQRPAEGLEIANRALAAEPQNGVMRFYAARFLSMLNRKAEASKNYALACQDKSLPAAAYIEGGLYVLQNAPSADFQALLSALEKSAEASAKRALYALKAENAYRAKDFKGATAALETLLKEYPDSEFAKLDIAAIAYEEGGANAAISALEKFLKASPKDYTSQTALVNYLILKGSAQDLARAKEILAQIAHANPQSAFALATLSSALARTGALEAALEAARKAESLDPQSPEVLMQLGLRLASFGKYDEAVSNLERAYRARPDARTAAYLKATLLEAAKKADDLRTRLAFAKKCESYFKNSPEASKLAQDIQNELNRLEKPDVK